MLKNVIIAPGSKASASHGIAPNRTALQSIAQWESRGIAQHGTASASHVTYSIGTVRHRPAPPGSSRHRTPPGCIIVRHSAASHGIIPHSTHHARRRKTKHGVAHSVAKHGTGAAAAGSGAWNRWTAPWVDHFSLECMAVDDVSWLGIPCWLVS